MANRPFKPGILQQIASNFLKSLDKRLGRINRVVVGKDEQGNVYYEEQDETESNRAVHRGYLPGPQVSFDDPLPQEWEAWLRNRRKQPPASAEIARNTAASARRAARAYFLDASRDGAQPTSRDQLSRAAPHVRTTQKETVNGKTEYPKYPEYEEVVGQKYNQVHKKDDL